MPVGEVVPVAALEVDVSLKYQGGGVKGWKPTLGLWGLGFGLRGLGICCGWCWVLALLDLEEVGENLRVGPGRELWRRVNACEW